MATFLMSQVVADVRLAINDLGTIAPPRFSDAQILSMANQCLKRICILRPDLFALVTTMNTVAGAYQTPPADSMRFMEALAVVGVNNLNETNHEALDLMSNTWQYGPQQSPTNWMRHPRNPNLFLLYPPPPAGVQLLIEYAQSPPFYTLTQNPAILPDAYYPVVLDGTVALLESTDNEAVNSGRAKAMYDTFLAQLQANEQARTLTDNEGAGMTPGTDPGVV